jgi:hypothetical protein
MLQPLQSHPRAADEAKGMNSRIITIRRERCER